MTDLSEVPVCASGASCSAIKKAFEIDQRRKLMQFLMLLNDDYDNVRGHILLLNPLPTVNNAYSMVQMVERQRTVTNSIGGAREVAANVQKAGNISFGSSDSRPSAFMARNALRTKKDIKKKPKELRFCDHCQRTGHTIDQCFKLVGYPDWYEGPRDTSKDTSFKNKKPSPSTARMVANVVNLDVVQDSPLDEIDGKQGVREKLSFNIYKTSSVRYIVEYFRCHPQGVVFLATGVN